MLVRARAKARVASARGASGYRLRSKGVELLMLVGITLGTGMSKIPKVAPSPLFRSMLMIV